MHPSTDTVGREAVDEMLKAWQVECKDHPALHNQGNVLRDRLAAIPSLDAYDRGRRDILNELLALNPKAALAWHITNGGTEATFTNAEGKLPFDVVFWVATVAEQLGIKSQEELAEERKA